MKKEKYIVKGDWGVFKREICPLTGKERYTFVRYTLRHKIRLAIGIHGRMQDGSWCFDIPFKTNISWINRMQYIFMYYIGNKVLNSIIGYHKIK